MGQARDETDACDRLVREGHLGIRDDHVRLVPHRPEWSDAFEVVATKLRAVVPDARVAHVGSTAVPRCPAKPLIDVSVGVAVAGCLDAEQAAMCGLVFRAVNPESVLFALYAPGGLRIANVHVRYADTPAERWDLLWRDYLRTHDDEVSAYAEAKRRAAQARVDRAGYSEMKGRFVSEAAPRARRWAHTVGWRPSP